MSKFTFISTTHGLFPVAYVKTTKTGDQYKVLADVPESGLLNRKSRFTFYPSNNQLPFIREDGSQEWQRPGVKPKYGISNNAVYWNMKSGLTVGYFCNSEEEHQEIRKNITKYGYGVVGV